MANCHQRNGNREAGYHYLAMWLGSKYLPCSCPFCQLEAVPEAWGDGQHRWKGLCFLSDPLHCVGSLLISDYLIVGLFTLLDFQEFEGSNALFSVSSYSNLMKDVLNRCFLTKSSGADPIPRTWKSSAVFWHTTRCLWIISTNSFLWLLTLSFNNVMWIVYQ